MDYLQALGLGGRCCLILHHDDLGVTHAQNQAYAGLGLPTGAVMLPTAWAGELPGRAEVDLGVHITLNSEWRAPRYRPLTAGPSLRDPEGYLWATVEDAWAHIQAEEAEVEMRTQIEAALTLGFDITHIDTHMGTVLRPDLASIYHRLAFEYRVPALLPPAHTLDQWDLPANARAALKTLVANSPMPKITILDSYSVPLPQRRQWYLDTVRGLGPGLYELIHHAALATPEGRMLPDWERRQADYDCLSDPEFRASLTGMTLLTFRQLREVMRQTRG